MYNFSLNTPDIYNQLKDLSIHKNGERELQNKESGVKSAKVAGRRIDFSLQDINVNRFSMCEGEILQIEISVGSVMDFDVLLSCCRVCISLILYFDEIRYESTE